MANTDRLGLPLMEADQALKHITHNEALTALDAMIQLSAVALNALVPPGAPVTGEVYALGASATGDWLGHDNELAVWTEGGWRFVDPSNGWLLWDETTSALYVRNLGTWTSYSPVYAEFQNINFMGVNTTADATNRLAVASDAVLLSHDPDGSGDMRVKVNKLAVGQTAAHLFQVGYSARAEFGLTGDDDFHLKVTPDNFSTTFEALKVKHDTGELIAEYGLSVGHSSAPISVLHVIGPAGGGVPAVTIDGDGGSGDEPLRIRTAAGLDMCVIKGDGDIENSNNTYGALSDVSLKRDICPAHSQWNDIKKISLKNFRFKNQVADDKNARVHLGVIAQEIEEISPGLVSKNPAGLRGVKYSILYLKALGALQEAMHRIECREKRQADQD